MDDAPPSRRLAVRRRRVPAAPLGRPLRGCPSFARHSPLSFPGLALVAAERARGGVVRLRCPHLETTDVPVPPDNVEPGDAWDTWRPGSLRVRPSRRGAFDRDGCGLDHPSIAAAAGGGHQSPAPVPSRAVAEEEWLDAETVAAYLRLPTRLVYAMVNAGQVPGLRFPLRIRRHDLENCLERCRIGNRDQRARCAIQGHSAPQFRSEPSTRRVTGAEPGRLASRQRRDAPADGVRSSTMASTRSRGRCSADGDGGVTCLRGRR